MESGNTITVQVKSIDPNYPYTIKEAAAILDVHPETLKKWYEQGRISHSKIGYRTVRISGQDIIDFIQNHKTNNNASLEAPQDPKE